MKKMRKIGGEFRKLFLEVLRKYSDIRTKNAQDTHMYRFSIYKVNLDCIVHLTNFYNTKPKHIHVQPNFFLHNLLLQKMKTKDFGYFDAIKVSFG